MDEDCGRRTRLLMMVPHLGGGGAERVMARLAAGLARDAFDVHFAVFADDSPGAEALPEWVMLHRLEAGRVRWAAWKMLRLIWQVRPELIVTGMMHVSAMVLMLRPWMPRGTRIAVRVNTTVSRSMTGGLERRVYGLLLRRADGVICQSAAMAEDVIAHLGVDGSRVAVARNPVDVARICAEARVARQQRMEPRDGIHVVCVGRLSAEKGVDLLLDAWGLLIDRLGAEGTQMKLTIVGEGKERQRLEAMAARPGMAASVSFCGYAQDVSSWLGWADICVQPSRHEGMPNALLEAAAAGLALVATPSSEGVVELLRGDAGAWVASGINAEALADAMRMAIDAVWERRGARLGGDAFAHPFLEPFEHEAALQSWERCLKEICAEKRR